MKKLRIGNYYPVSVYNLSEERFNHYQIEDNERNLEMLEELGYGLAELNEFNMCDGTSSKAKKFFREFMDAFKKDKVEKTIGQNAYDASSAYDKGVSMLADWYQPFDEEGWAEGFKRKFIEQGQYDPSFVYKLFVAAKTNPRYYEQYEDINPDKVVSRKSVYNSMITEYALEGGDVETIKSMLNKQVDAMEKEMKENPDIKDAMWEDYMALNELVGEAKEMPSPYNVIFNNSTELYAEKKKHDKLMQDPNVSQELLDKMEMDIAEKEKALKEEMMKWDPEMLQQVAQARKDNISFDAEKSSHGDIKIVNYSPTQANELGGVIEIQKFVAKQIQMTKDAEANRD